VDLFLDENRLGDMPSDIASYFVREMCRASNAVWHRNHEAWRNRFDDGRTSPINREYPISVDFEEVARHCDPADLMNQGRLDCDSDMFWHYYRRKCEPGGAWHASRSRTARMRAAHHDAVPKKMVSFSNVAVVNVGRRKPSPKQPDRSNSTRTRKRSVVTRWGSATRAIEW